MIRLLLAQLKTNWNEEGKAIIQGSYFIEGEWKVLLVFCI